jgi:hypothetical protein
MCACTLRASSAWATRRVLDRQIKKSNSQPMYFLIFATDNDAGERIMDWVFDRVRLRVEEELG